MSTTPQSQIQTVLLFIAALMFGFGALVQIADQRDQSATPVTYKALKTPADIVQLTNPVEAVAYTSVVSLAPLPVAEKKQRFIALLLPAILISKQHLQQQRSRLEQLLSQSALNSEEQAWLEQLKSTYDTDSPAELRQRMIGLPNSLILAQAAIETGWGSSRFFVQANNVFGVWSFDPNEKRIMAQQMRDDQAVFVKRYDSLLGAIEDYFLTLARGKAYIELRQAARHTQNSLELIKHLHRYSELGDDYVKRLETMIRQNRLRRYDSYQLSTRSNSVSQ
ncbi:glucosaminidase domain-containing protein [Amphritea pacifica]|uniref:Glucosaminidase domain-containing protein n=1 Tax=Amphritea pacifica TaxID=2811233 RepID=A0ABS2W4C6_9GAMM|nr:glucosaminidase domain-containing protein [Amphritea pacifica]MBN0986430.1 glucosaminidase domain-containing protein [Amphritea pacifica]MBN1006428.1 glucosaminidase domain-containing protein [Amphritea pacifica]